MVADVLEVEHLLRLIRNEYWENPTLNLTKRQVQRLWNLDAAVCDHVLDALLRQHVLRRSAHGRYILDRPTP